MLDFTSALYLGLEHASWGLPDWERLTLGKPAALEPPPGAVEVERDLAALVGCERALLAPSTLHIFWDLLTILAQRGVNIFLDGGSYPVARWGAERAAAAGTPVAAFRRHDIQSLRAAIESADRKPPVVVADGYCVGCGTPAPIAGYLECTAARNGLVVIDDTQAMGIFGSSPSLGAPYGRGGGGSLRRARIRDRRVVVASSLAKAFGAPIAMLAASDAIVAEFERGSATRMHSSPPSAAAIAAAGSALAVNRRCGDRLRWSLARRVVRLRHGLRKLHLAASAGMFPVQPLRLPGRIGAGALYDALMDCGVQAVLHRGSDSAAAGISFVVTARHTLREIDYAVECLVSVMSREMRWRFKGGNGNGESIRFTGEALRSVFGSPQ